ncbi:hypothetical protein ACEQ8H_005282 [Pleosporales sp. CAS-2024a]
MFDKASGVLYSETTSEQVTSMVPTWMSEARGRHSRQFTLRSRGRGCSKLDEMALRSCAFYADMFEPETLRWAGWHYTNRIYQHLIHNEALSYNAWTIFLTAYPNNLAPHQDFHVYAPNTSYSKSPTQLSSIVTRLAKLPTTLLTHLHIRDFALTLDHLKLLLLDLPSLAALVLEQARPSGPSALTTTPRHVSDVLRAASEKHAAQKLTFLLLRGFALAPTAVLNHAACLSSLSLVALQDARTSVAHDDGYADESQAWRRLDSTP